MVVEVGKGLKICRSFVVFFFFTILIDFRRLNIKVVEFFIVLKLVFDFIVILENILINNFIIVRK